MPALFKSIGQTRLSPGVRDILISEIFGVSKESTLIDPDQDIPQIDLNRFHDLEKRILAGEPYQYVINKAFFFGESFFADKRVLIPRPETELLVERAIKFLRDYPKNQEIQTLDIGTGSGIIPIILIKELLKSNIKIRASASDISNEALQVAKINAQKHGVKIDFSLSDLCENITGKFDLITANLPYIGQKDKDHPNLPDPKIALIGGRTGFEMIADTIEKLKDHLKDDGVAVFEIGYNHRKDIQALEKKLTGFNFDILKDNNQYDRVLVVSWKAPRQA